MARAARDPFPRAVDRASAPIPLSAPRDRGAPSISRLAGSPGGYRALVDLVEALRTTGAARQFLPDPVPDEVLVQVLDDARFAPSGGNRQGWRVVVIRDPAIRRQIRDLYLDGWHQYLAMGAAGLVPWAPVTDLQAEAAAR